MRYCRQYYAGGQSGPAWGHTWGYLGMVRSTLYYALLYYAVFRSTVLRSTVLRYLYPTVRYTATVRYCVLCARCSAG